MLEQELVELVRKIQEGKFESNYIEVKAAAKGCPKIRDTLSSFSNQSGGGRIVFGVDEEKDYALCGVYDAADLQKKIMEQSLEMEPVVRPLCTAAVIDGKTVVCAEIQEIDHFQKPCFYTGKGRLKASKVYDSEIRKKTSGTLPGVLFFRRSSLIQSVRYDNFLRKLLNGFKVFRLNLKQFFCFFICNLRKNIFYKVYSFTY